jgi:hypothetical protein
MSQDPKKQRFLKMKEEKLGPQAAPVFEEKKGSSRFLKKRKREEAELSRRQSVILQKVQQNHSWFHEWHLRCWLDLVVDIQREMNKLSCQSLLRAQCMFLQLLLNPKVEIVERGFELILMVCVWQQHKAVEWLEDDNIPATCFWTTRPSVTSICCYFENEYSADQVKETEWDIFQIFEFDVYLSVKTLYEQLASSSSLEVDQKTVDQLVLKEALSDDPNELKWFERLLGFFLLSKEGLSKKGLPPPKKGLPPFFVSKGTLKGPKDVDQKEEEEPVLKKSRPCSFGQILSFQTGATGPCFDSTFTFEKQNEPLFQTVC